MKRPMLALIAAALLAGSLAAAPAALSEGRGHGDHDGGHDRGGGRDRGGERGGDRGGERHDGGWDRGRHDGDRGGRFEGDGRGWRGERWDERRNNGYWFNNRWSYGPPPEDYYGLPGFRLGFSDWRRGAYLPPFYRDSVVEDFDRYRLRRPPYGYHWVRVGDEFLLVSSASGLIFDIITIGR